MIDIKTDFDDMEDGEPESLVDVYVRLTPDMLFAYITTGQVRKSFRCYIQESFMEAVFYMFY